MRRTLFVFPREDVPIVQAAVSTPLAAMLRRRLISHARAQRGRAARRPATSRRWLDTLASRSSTHSRTRGSGHRRRTEPPTCRRCRTAIPVLRAVRPAAERHDQPCSPWMSAAGRLVRGTPTGAWTSRQHRWEHASQWWPTGCHAWTLTKPARRSPAATWRASGRQPPTTCSGGPAGPRPPSAGRSTACLSTRSTCTASLASRCARITQARPTARPTTSRTSRSAATATRNRRPLRCCPPLTPPPWGGNTASGCSASTTTAVFDGAGNIGPTVWWNGEVIGSWAITAAGELRTRILADRGSDAAAAVDTAAARLHAASRRRLGHPRGPHASRTHYQRHNLTAGQLSSSGLGPFTGACVADSG